MLSNSSYFQSPLDSKLTTVQVESIIENVEVISPTSIGSEKWRLQYANNEKLGSQVTKNLRSGMEEFVSDTLIQLKKLPTIIEELANIHSWKVHVFPSIETHLSKNAPILGYALLRYEGLLLHLLQASLFKKEAIRIDTDALILLSDTLMGYITWLNTKPNFSIKSDPETLLEHKSVMEWDEAWTALAALSHLSHHLDQLDVAILSRLLRMHDLGNQLVYLICNAPWYQGSQVYEEGKWIPKSEEVPKLEGLVWIALTSWFPLVSQELTPHRYDVWIKLIPYCEHVHSTLSFIEPMYRHLLHLQMSPPTFFSSVHQGIHEFVWSVPNFECDWKSQFTTEANTHMAKLLASSFDYLEEDTPAKCSWCGTVAMQRCSKCKLEWYCSRPCQVKAWKKHKEVCNLFTSSTRRSNELNF